MKLGGQQTVATQLMIMLGRQTRIGEHRQIYISTLKAVRYLLDGWLRLEQWTLPSHRSNFPAIFRSLTVNTRTRPEP
jgi:hypothetical protein